MHIPTTITVGRTRYTVRMEPPKGRKYGTINYQECIIRIRPRKPARQALTFWHETTHAILFEMHHPLYADEKFVERFSTLLHKAITSARFE